jgi:hypothetical protein
LKEVRISRAFFYTSGSPNRAPIERDAPFLEPSFHYLSQFPVNGPPLQIPQQDPYRERHPSTEPSKSRPLKIHLSLRVPIKEAPSMFPDRLPVEEDTPFPEPLFNPFMSTRVPKKGALLQNGKKHKVTFHGAHTDGRYTYSGVPLGSPRGLLTTLLSIPQCHAALGTIPSTLAWVDRSPMCCSNFQQGILSTPVTTFHVT